MKFAFLAFDNNIFYVKWKIILCIFAYKKCFSIFDMKISFLTISLIFFTQIDDLWKIIDDDFMLEDKKSRAPL